MSPELFVDDKIYIMIYAAVTALDIVACCYLLFRRGNAFAPDVTPPLRLRRWTAAFFGAMALSHLWYMPLFFLTSTEDKILCNAIGGMLDGITIFPVTINVLLTMQQDKRRPLWPFFVCMAPFVMGMIWCIFSRNLALVPMLRIYFLLLSIGSVIYMVRALRQYGRWLRDNYADLEHKEVWQIFLSLTILLLMIDFYAAYIGGVAYEYIVQICGLLIVCYLPWHVETISDLSLSQQQSLPEPEPAAAKAECMEGNDPSQSLPDKIGPLLQKYCIDTRLYLQHDLTLHQLSRAIGTNRFYLSQYFSSKNTNYNAYINDLRINRFVSLYRDTVAKQKSFTVQQLAHNSGYRSYSTFTLAFKQRMGKNVTTWMRESAG